MSELTVIEVCAGAGGQALGLEQAGFAHRLAIELDSWAAKTLRSNLGADVVKEGDVADRTVFNPLDHVGQVDLLAGGVPCPPFSVAGRQLGASDERDLFAWAVETASQLEPRALLLENVRGLSAPRFRGYRQHVLDRLKKFGYVAEWRLLHAADYGVPQLRPRFVLVALRPEDWPFFSWPTRIENTTTVGTSLRDLMAANSWEHADEWMEMARGIAPTIVGGSKKHGGADLGPTRAKAAWRLLGVDALGVADDAPQQSAPHPSVRLPRLTVGMVARIQGWVREDQRHQVWLENLAGRKTAQYRQIGNAFPPPVARALGDSLISALRHEKEHEVLPTSSETQDGIYRVLSASRSFLTSELIMEQASEQLTLRQFERRIAHLSEDFHVETRETPGGPAYRISGFKAFVGQDGHGRHEYMRTHRSRVS
ncbi:DNA cytosine methyltransferase [Aquipuribacter sp. SD81]|uniref:DNA cytosine methyltransferase n=1 Tax=Aquipuribacter sp. SD81 TaxID=3127703 RepID=UPI003019DC3E